MTKNYEYNENLVITDEDTHKALVSHFNQIENIAKSKKFEWEDEQIPEEHFGITFDFDEWLNLYVDNYNDVHLEEKPENLKEDTIGYVNQIKDYIDGFMLQPVVLYNRNSFAAKSYRIETENFDEIVDFMKNLKEEYGTVLLYEISYTPQRTDTTVVEKKHGNTDYTETRYPANAFYKIRYGLVENGL